MSEKVTLADACAPDVSVDLKQEPSPLPAMGIVKQRIAKYEKEATELLNTRAALSKQLEDINRRLMYLSNAGQELTSLLDEAKE